MAPASMPSIFMSLQDRRAMHERAAAAAADPSGRSGLHREAGLLEACRRFNELERKKIRLLNEGGGDEFHLQVQLSRLSMSQAAHLEAMCAARASTIRGHRARAMAYLLWDSGELAYRVDTGATTDDLILQALLRDLSTSKP